MLHTTHVRLSPSKSGAWAFLPSGGERRCPMGTFPLFALRKLKIHRRTPISHSPSGIITIGRYPRFLVISRLWFRSGRMGAQARMIGAGGKGGHGEGTKTSITSTVSKHTIDVADRIMAVLSVSPPLLSHIFSALQGGKTLQHLTGQ